MSKKTGMSLHIGINELNPAGYMLTSPDEPPHEKFPNGWAGKLGGCHNDAEAMYAIAKENNFDAEILLTAEATADRVKAEVKKAADTLEAGDIFLLTYAGHGGQVPDVSKDEGMDVWGKVDKWDETWCMYDRHLIDDEQMLMYTEFKPGVRIVVFSDSCHSGGINRSGEADDEDPAPRAMDRQTAHACYFPRKKEYDDLQLNLKKVTEDDVKANFLLISACGQYELAGDGDPNGAFTSAFLRVWDKGNFDGTYKQLHQLIQEDFKKNYDADKARFERGERTKPPKTQSPKFQEGKSRDPSFYEQRPFSID